MSLCFYDLGSAPPSYADAAGTTCIIVGGSRALLEAITESHPLFAALALPAAAALPFIKAGAQRLAPKKDTPSACELLVPLPEGVYRRVVVAALPTCCSRNNTPSLAHSVSAVVKANKGSGNLAVALLPSDPSHSFAQSVAVARCFPRYSQSSSARAAAKSGEAPDAVYVFAPFGGQQDALEDARAVAANISLAQRLVDMPPNELNCATYIAEAEEAVRLLPGVTTTMICGEDLEAQGFGGIYNVGKASDHRPALMVLSHVPAGADGEKSVCLVGKGIVYDTGGLSIKVPPGMYGMKSDMGGSAAVLSAFVALVSRGGLRRPLHALLCIAENSVDSSAMRPDDVIIMLSGKSVEVNNTDAEGRLVLADGVFYASQKLNPEVIVDIATLTGAQLIITGKKHAAVYCSHPEVRPREACTLPIKQSALI